MQFCKNYKAFIKTGASGRGLPPPTADLVLSKIVSFKTFLWKIVSFLAKSRFLPLPLENFCPPLEKSLRTPMHQEIKSSKVTFISILFLLLGVKQLTIDQSGRNYEQEKERPSEVHSFNFFFYFSTLRILGRAGTCTVLADCVKEFGFWNSKILEKFERSYQAIMRKKQKKLDIFNFLFYPINGASEMQEISCKYYISQGRINHKAY